MARKKNKTRSGPKSNKKKAYAGDFMKGMKNDVFEATEKRDMNSDDESEASNDAHPFFGNVYEKGFSDEEIDEDGAFNDDDEEMYGSVMHSINKRKKKKNAQESDEEEEEDLEPMEGEGMLLSEILDQNLKKDAATESKPSKSERKYDSDASNVDEDSDEDSDDDLSESEKRENILKLASMVAKDDTKRSKAFVGEQTEIRNEGEFNVVKSSGLQLDSLVSSLKDSKSYGKLKKRLDKVDKASEVSKPIARVVEERADRKVGYDNASEHVKRWQPFVKANREAKTVKFPLDRSGRVQATTNSLAAQFVPETNLEGEIQNLLEASGLDGDAAVMKKEEDHLKAKCDPAEVKRKQQELAKLRFLMYYEEKKAKRTKKIKSKMYRKIRKRKRAREEEKEEEILREMDPEAAKLLDEEAALQRAQERMSLRHKNTSRFMRNLIKHQGAVREDTREIITEQLEREAQLKKKMQRIESDSSDSEHELPDHQESESKDNTPEPGSIFSLKFMQRGKERRQRERAAEEKFMEKAMNGDDGSDSDDAPTQAGRRSFNLTGQKKELLNMKTGIDTMNNSAIEGRKSKRSKTSGALSVKSKAPTFEVTDFETPSDDEPSKEKISAKSARNFVEDKTEANNNNESTSNPWIQSSTSAREKKTQEKETAKSLKASDAQLNMEKVASLGKTQDSKKKASANKKNADKQMEVMKRAFTNAVAEEDFETERRELIEAEEEKNNPKEVSLPGWGSWAGEGVAPPKPRKRKNANRKDQNKNKKAKPSILQGQPKHVIVSNKTNKKAAKYNLEKVPYPFTSREQYERSLQNPLGSDWNTVGTFKKNIQPEVVTKMGTIIEPAKFSTTNKFVQKNDATSTMRRNAKKKEVRLKHRRQRQAKM